MPKALPKQRALLGLSNVGGQLALQDGSAAPYMRKSSFAEEHVPSPTVFGSRGPSSLLGRHAIEDGSVSDGIPPNAPGLPPQQKHEPKIPGPPGPKIPPVAGPDTPSYQQRLDDKGAEDMAKAILGGLGTGSYHI